MAHFIKLSLLDLTHDNERSYNQVLINLDKVISIEPSSIHTIVYTESNTSGLRVKENIDEILKLSLNQK